MKSKFLIVFGLLLASVGVFAQNYFGVTGGYNLSNIRNADTPYVEYHPQSGFNVGVAYEHRFSTNGKGYPFLDASILYSLERYKGTPLVDNYYDLVFSAGSSPSFDEGSKFLKIPVSFGYNFQLTDKFGIAPKIFGIFDADMSDPPSSGSDKFFAFGGGANFNIGERFSIGVGYDFRRDIYGFADEYILFDNYHANLTYYIFSK